MKKAVIVLAFAVSTVASVGFATTASFYYTNKPKWPLDADVNIPAIYNMQTQILNEFPSENFQGPSHRYVYTFNGSLAQQGILNVTYGHQGEVNAPCFIAGQSHVKHPTHPVYALTWDNTHPDWITLSCKEVD